MLPGLASSLLGGVSPLKATLSAGRHWELVSENIYEASVGATVSGGYPPYTYFWAGNANITGADQGTPAMRYTIGAPTDRIVNCTITDAAGAVVVPTTTILEPLP